MTMRFMCPPGSAQVYRAPYIEVHRFRWFTVPPDGRPRLDIFQRLADGQRRQDGAVLLDEGAHRFRVGPGVLAQRPTDRLADEEVLVVGPGQAVAEEPVDVGP